MMRLATARRQRQVRKGVRLSDPPSWAGAVKEQGEAVGLTALGRQDRPGLLIDECRSALNRGISGDSSSYDN